MHTTKLFPYTVLASSLLMMSSWAMAHEGHDMMSASPTTTTPNSEMVDHSQMNHTQMDHSKIDHSQHQQHQNPAVSTENRTAHQGHDHRKEHGAQIYAISTIDTKWLVNEDGEGALKSEIETRIGTDENKLFIKIHTDKAESHDAHFDAKVLYSRMIADFWDVQAGVRYRSQKVELDHHVKDSEEQLDAVIGLHGMAPYFFETDAYFYAGEENYSGLSLETERDLLLTQKLIFKPYLDLDVVFSDDSKYAKKSGLSSLTTGIETRYEISKKVMPYLDIAYEYSKGNDETPWQVESDSEQGWLYGAGVRFKF
ncbi:copper resistance protein B [Acinetobacter sichuanensis]|uniref:Copper resistance protein B n=1 Tax=Acinetobacter sichuanensis TaxID=2136183 RepID=A0A371YLZ1_9GAMM|nr:copper resistance protein B [Acinetobacter sichuanensis]RFC82483.1 copper resistance protein B [Acinetobacter sichuanensis]